MKNYLIIILILCLIGSPLACKSQQLIQKPSDIINLKQDNSRFIGKPLKDLLKEIRPAIRTVSATSTNNQHSKNGYIIFRFVNRTEIDTIRNKGKIPYAIAVYFEEPFEWDEGKNIRSKNDKFTWTKDDISKYGNLTIRYLRILGNE